MLFTDENVDKDTESGLNIFHAFDKGKGNAMVDNRACNKPVEKLWFRGVRSSKFRHVFGLPAKRERCYDNVKITKNAHDSHFCAVNPKFVAVVTEVAGGGAFLVLPIDRTGRIDFNVSRVTGHRGPVLDIKWNPFNDNIIASCSDDCTIKLWYIPDGGLSSHLTEWLIDLHGHKRRVGYIEWHPTAENILVSAGFDHLIILWDVGKGEALNVIDCHPDVIYSLSFNKDGSRLATTCKDKKLRIIDPRSGYVISEGMCHAGTRSSKVAYLGGSGRLVTTGFARHSDRQIAIWAEDSLAAPLHVETVDSSSGVIFPYYDADTSMLYLAGKGDGNIRYYEVVDEAPWIHFLSQYLSGSPQNLSEVFRFYKLHATRGMCEPISMIVPRKSDQFQEDLYPDTAAPVPALSASDWLNGINRAPVLMSMKTGVTVRTHKPKAFKGSDAARAASSDNNYRMKFAFLSKETIPDYRPLEGLPESEKSQKTSSNQSTKFQQLQQMFGNNIVQNEDDDLSEKIMNIKVPDRDEFEESPKNEYQLQRAYSRQCEELKLLRRQLASRDRRIQDLEQLITKLQQQRKLKQ
ncbi:hypothetical protein LSTR_LSTR005231 [Laodelphax striatellus]|uniref:Coronin n=1 Tax=Laodelphax striatellus TaxID=195883 RepID=A0A482XBZ7_LAOST|nr:hypothetical protein LSTR_LSTR005231 [Laodelphax striatellus]